MLFGFASALSAASAGPLWAAPVAAPFIHLLALQLFAIGFALFGRPLLVFDAGATFSAGAFFLLCRNILLCHWSAGFRIRLHVLRSGCPPPSSNIAAVVDNSRRFLRETSPEGQDLWDASTLLYGCI
jgi:hypothetical protein